jgi:hypothetical protein
VEETEKLTNIKTKLNNGNSRRQENHFLDGGRIEGLPAKQANS